MIGASRSGWVVAASIGAVEALKDQLGVCRWNYPLKSLQKRATTGIQSYFHTHILPPPNSSSSGAAGEEATATAMGERVERREIGLKKVMDLSCWGPTTVRF